MTTFKTRARLVATRAGDAVILAAKAFAAIVGPGEAALFLALVLLAAGFWSWWRPGSYLAPAAVLLWLFVPTRHRFIVPSASPGDAGRKQ